MRIEIQIPESVEAALQVAQGANLAQAITEDLAVAWYRTERRSIGQVARFLGTTTYEAEGLMKRHGVAANYTADDLERDRETLARLLP